MIFGCDANVDSHALGTPKEFSAAAGSKIK